MELILENVRCFAERQNIPVKPLTLLVGENSAGKSTFLAMLSAASNPYSFPLRPRFNDAPYDLGNYDTIATYKHGRGIRAKSFSIGYTKTIKRQNDVLHIVGTYRDNGGAADIAQVDIVNNKFQLQMILPKTGQPQVVLTSQQNGVTQVYDAVVTGFNNVRRFMMLDDLGYLFEYRLRSEQDKSSNRKPQRLMDIDEDFVLLLHNMSQTTTLSLAPIRSEPERTYTEVVEEFSPTGRHIPYVLIDFLQDDDNRAVLESFGKASGLFSKVAVKQWGKKRSDPLQVMVTNEGRPASSAANLVDVGYGVSQALPLVVQSMLAAPESRLLLQQPEVHLHPRAQAALGTLFVDLLATTKKQFVVETHSDYILDRVRQEVAKGRVAASDVGILYFERGKNGTRVYPISVDEIGNLLNVPPSYRAFFLKEDMALFNMGGYDGAYK